MAQTLAGIQEKIAEVEAAISKTVTAQSYGKGDKSVQRAQLAELQTMLSSLRRDEAIFEARANGSKTGLLTAAFH